MVAVFLTKIQPVNASPDRFFLTLDRPGASAVGGTALATNEEFRQSVFAGVSALLGFPTFLFHFPLACAPCQFLLRSTKGGGVDNCRMIILHIILGARLSIVALDLLAQAVHNVGFIDDGVAFVSFVLQDRAYRGTVPFSLPARGGYTHIIQRFHDPPHSLLFTQVM